MSGGGGWMPSYTIWVFALWEIQTRWILRRRQGLYYTELSLTALWGWERKQLRDYWHPKRKGWRLGTRVWQGEDRDGGGGGPGVTTGHGGSGRANRQEDDFLVSNLGRITVPLGEMGKSRWANTGVTTVASGRETQTSPGRRSAGSWKQEFWTCLLWALGIWTRQHRTAAWVTEEEEVEREEGK